MSDLETSAKNHTPVLLEEVLRHYPLNDKPQRYGLDGTFGRGGHTRALLDHDPRLTMIALDQDHEAIECAKSEFKELIAQGRLFAKAANFVDSPEVMIKFKQELNFEGLDFILLDLGVSSPQLDCPERGFSFYHDGPLDMRMDQSKELKAEEIINDWPQEDLVEIFQTLGEVRSPHRVVRAIVHDRKEKHFNSTLDLAEMIARIDGWRKKGHHPATKYFMALRLRVNEELDVISQVIPGLIDELTPGGRLMIITFHSLEDRIVKRAFKAQLEKGRLVNKKVIIATREEQKLNARSRSAKLRIFEKGLVNEET